MNGEKPRGWKQMMVQVAVLGALVGGVAGTSDVLAYWVPSTTQTCYMGGWKCQKVCVMGFFGNWNCVTGCGLDQESDFVGPPNPTSPSSECFPE